MKLLLVLSRYLFQLIPIKKGKLTAAHYLQTTIFKGIDDNVIAERSGYKMRFNFSDRMQTLFYLTGLYEPNTVALCGLQFAEKSEQVYVDVGANVGLIALQVLKSRPEIKSYLFEPDPDLCSSLKENISLNGIGNVQICQLAVSDGSKETLSFHKSYQRSESGWGRLENNSNHELGEKIAVASISLDQYFKDISQVKITLLKIDVEGAEVQVLRGASRLLSEGRIESIICEINAEALAAFSSSEEQVKKILGDFGYQEQARVEMNVLYCRSSIVSGDQRRTNYI